MSFIFGKIADPKWARKQETWGKRRGYWGEFVLEITPFALKSHPLLRL
jgi:hypothetical protein